MEPRSTENPELLRDPVLAALAQGAGSRWGWTLAYGILLIVFGLLVVMNPLVAGVATGVMVGLALIVSGIAALAAGTTHMSTRARWLEIALGVIALVAGAFVLFNPVAGALSLVWAIGAWLAISGVIQIAWAFQVRHDRGWRLFMGGLDLLLGLLLLFSSPTTGLAFLAMVLMISFVVRGVFLIALALGLRKVTKAIRARM